jgi:hypothetical protein
MRKEALRVYQTYMATFDGQFEAMMQIFDARAKGTALAMPIDWDNDWDTVNSKQQQEREKG